MINASELLVVFVVTLLAFGPKHLPSLLSTGAWLIKKFQNSKNVLSQQWGQFLNEQQLLENLNKAREADKRYKQEESHE